MGGTLTFSGDGRRFLNLTGQNGRIFDAENGREVVEIPRVISFSFYGHNGSLAVSTLDGFEIWDSITGQRTYKAPVSSRVFWNGVAWSENGVRAIDLGSSKESACHIRLWDLASGRVADRFPCPPDAVYSQSVLISPDMERVLLSWGDTYVENNRYIPSEFGLFDLKDGKEVTRPMNPKVHVLGFSPNGKTFLVGGRNFVVYSSDSGEPLITHDLLGPLCTEPACDLLMKRSPDY